MLEEDLPISVSPFLSREVEVAVAVAEPVEPMAPVKPAFEAFATQKVVTMTAADATHIAERIAAVTFVFTVVFIIIISFFVGAEPY